MQTLVQPDLYRLLLHLRQRERQSAAIRRAPPPSAHFGGRAPRFHSADRSVRQLRHSSERGDCRRDHHAYHLDAHRLSRQGTAEEPQSSRRSIVSHEKAQLADRHGKGCFNSNPLLSI